MTLPIHPGQTFYLVDPDDRIAPIIAITATAVGVSYGSRLLVVCYENKLKVGLVDRVFLTRSDAERALEDPGAIGWNYGVAEVSDLPFQLGENMYQCEYEDGKWYIDIDTVDYIVEDGKKVIVGSDGLEFTVGKDPIFQTEEEADAYIEEQMRGV